MNGRRFPRRGFTIVELMVVLAVIVLLLGLLIPVLGAFRKSGLMTRSMGNMRQIAGWMALYAGDNRETVVPSQFDYRENSYRGKVRSKRTLGYGEEHRGTWADIIWTVFELGVFPDAIEGGSGGTPNPGGTPGGGPGPCPSGPCSPCHDFRYDSPDRELYCRMGRDIDNPLRSAAANTRGTLNGSPQNLATPYGCGAQEAGQPGYFAANNFFNADGEAVDCWTNQDVAAEWYARGQIRAPDRSMYLVDSVAGEVITPTDAPYQYFPTGTPGGPGVDGDEPPLGPVEVDFRYTDACLMLYLDSHIGTQVPWVDLYDLEGEGQAGDVNGNGRIDPGRGVRIRNLTSR